MVIEKYVVFKNTGCGSNKGTEMTKLQSSL